MSRALSTTAKNALFAQQTSEVFIILLTISHPSFDDDIRVASDPFELLPVLNVKGVVSRGEEFVFIPFDIKLPDQTDSNIARATLTVDNISREITAAVRTADSSVSVKIEVVLASDPNTVEISIDDFRLNSVTYNAFTVSGELSMDYYDLEPFPSSRFNPSDFPGLF